MPPIRRTTVVSLITVIPSVFTVNPSVVAGVQNTESFDHLSVKNRHTHVCVLRYVERSETSYETPLEPNLGKTVSVMFSCCDVYLGVPDEIGRVTQHCVHVKYSNKYCTEIKIVVLDS